MAYRHRKDYPERQDCHCFPPPESNGRNRTPAQADFTAKLLSGCGSAFAKGSRMGRAGWGQTHENYDKAPSGGRHARIRRQAHEGCILCDGGSAEIVGGLLIIHRQRREPYGPGGYFRLRRHPLLPHPLHLLQFCQPHHRKENGAAGTLSGGSGAGNPGHSPIDETKRQAPSHPVHRRWHPHHPHYASDDPASGHPAGVL